MSERTGSPRFTPAQEAALDLTRDVAVVAGAGSGKTRVLTERYLRALDRVRHERAPLPRVVALTFTEKATTEMRERVRAGVRSRLPNARRAGDVERVAFWRRIESELHTARILTIDAFWASLVRMFPLEAGLDPDVEILDAPTAQLLVAESIQAALGDVATRDPGDDGEAAALARLLGSYRPVELRNMLARLGNARDRAHRWRRALAMTTEADRIASVRQDHEARTAASMAAIRRDVDTDLLVSIARGADLKTVDLLADHVRAAAPLAQALLADEPPHPSDLTAAIDSLTRRHRDGPRRFTRVGRKDAWPGGIGPWRDALGRLAPALHAHLAWFEPFDEERERLTAALTTDLATLSAACEDRLVAATGHGRRTDFSGLSIAADRILGNAGCRRRLRAEIDYLLVDEFQDTNPQQWALIRALVEHERDGEHAGVADPATSPTAHEEPPGEDTVPVNVFIVGDAKQAIYEFRGGRVEVFREAEAWIRSRGGAVVEMSTNFRSATAPLSVVNHLFDRIFGGDAGERAPYDASPQILEHGRPDGSSGSVRLLVSDPGDGWATEADRIARTLIDALEGGLPILDPATGEARPAAWEDVAVIVPYRRDFVYLEDAFARRGVPYHVLGGMGFFQTNEVGDVIALLETLTDPRQDIALVAFLRSPFANVSDEVLWRLAERPESGFRAKLEAAVQLDGADRHVRGATGDRIPPESDALDGATRRTLARLWSRLYRWRRLLGRVPTSTILSRALDESAYSAVNAIVPGGGRAAANLRKLLDLVREFESHHGIRPARVAAWLRQQAENVFDEGEATDTGAGEGATLMTIHRSKGTEHPVLVVAGLGERTTAPDPVPLVVSDDVDRVTVALKVPCAPDEDGRPRDELTPSARYRLWKLVDRRRREAESRRVLYVALTRARDHLVLSGERPKSLSESTALGRLAAADEALAGAIAAGGETDVTIGVTPVRVGAAGPAAEPADAVPVRVAALRHALREAIGRPPAAPANTHATEPTGRAAGDASTRRVTMSPPTLTVTALAAIAVHPTPPHSPIVESSAPTPAATPSASATRDDPGSAQLTFDFDAPAPAAAPPEAARASEPAAPRGVRSTDRQRARERGESVHDVLARARSIEDLDPGVDARVRRHAETFLRSRWGRESAETARTEVAFALPVGRARLEGMIDRLYRDPGGVWTVVDYKTTRLGDDAPADVVRSEGHDVQVALYALASAALLCLSPESRMRAVVFFTDPDAPLDDAARAVVSEVTVADLPGPSGLGAWLGAGTWPPFDPAASARRSSSFVEATSTATYRDGVTAALERLRRSLEPA